MKTTRMAQVLAARKWQRALEKTSYSIVRSVVDALVSSHSEWPDLKNTAAKIKQGKLNLPPVEQEELIHAAYNAIMADTRDHMGARDAALLMESVKALLPLRDAKGILFTNGAMQSAFAAMNAELNAIKQGNPDSVIGGVRNATIAFHRKLVHGSQDEILKTGKVTIMRKDGSKRTLGIHSPDGYHLAYERILSDGSCSWCKDRQKYSRPGTTFALHRYDRCTRAIVWLPNTEKFH